MSLSSGLSIARSALFVAADQTSTVSRNIANASNPLYTRKTANAVTVPGYGPTIASVTRASEPILLRNLFNANSDANARQAVTDALNQLDETVNDPELDTSAAALIGKLADAIQQYSAQPHSELAGQAAVRAAQDVANRLNSASDLVQDVRRQADQDMAASVGRINTLLEKFDAINTQITQGTRAGTDVTDYLDSRDLILNDLSTEIGIRTMVRGDNDMAVFTDSGITLFDRSARSVTFDQSLSLGAGTVGNAVIIDGVPVTGPGSPMPLVSGRIKGLAEIRDEAGVTYQRQLDEMARSLVEIFAESDQDPAPSLADAAGLFTWPGGPGIPPSGTIVDGIAGVITVNANVDPDKGGLVTRLRDGGIADPLITNYVYNLSGATGFSDRLNALNSALRDTRSFDPAAGVDSNATLLDFSSSSVAWISEARKTANGESEYRNTLYQRSSEAYSKMTGVNLDEEMTTLLELERSYQTSSKLVSVIDQMFDTLVSAVG